MLQITLAGKHDRSSPPRRIAAGREAPVRADHAFAPRPLACRDDLGPAERRAVRRALAVALAAFTVLVLAASALAAFGAGGESVFAVLGP